MSFPFIKFGVGLLVGAHNIVTFAYNLFLKLLGNEFYHKFILIHQCELVRAREHAFVTACARECVRHLVRKLPLYHRDTIDNPIALPDKRVIHSCLYNALLDDCGCRGNTMVMHCLVA